MIGTSYDGSDHGDAIPACGDEPASPGAGGGDGEDGGGSGPRLTAAALSRHAAKAFDERTASRRARDGEQKRRQGGGKRAADRPRIDAGRGGWRRGARAAALRLDGSVTGSTAVAVLLRF